MLLALDLGMHCGWALFTGAGARLASGTWHFGKNKRARSQGQRVATIAHEHVASLHQHAGADAAHLFGGWLMLLAMVGRRTGARIVRVEQPQVYAASGVRKASPREFPDKGLRREENKRRLIAAARVRWPSIADDNEADACFVGLAAMAKGTGVDHG